MKRIAYLLCPTKGRVGGVDKKTDKVLKATFCKFEMDFSPDYQQRNIKKQASQT